MNTKGFIPCFRMAFSALATATAFGLFVPAGGATAEYTSYQATYGSRLMDIAAYSDGRCVGLAECRPSSGNLDFGLIRFNQDGTFASAVAAGGTGADSIACGTITVSGDVICGGGSWSFGLPYTSQMLMRFTDTGTFLSARIIQFESDSEIRGVAPAADGGFFTCGYTIVTSNPVLRKATVCRFSDAGVLQWCTMLDDWYFSLWVKGITQTSDGGCIVSGTIGSTGMENLVVFKLAGDGSLEWHKHIGAFFYINGIFIQETGGYYVIACSAWDIPMPFLWLRLTATGDLDRAFRYDAPDGDLLLESMAMTSDGKFIGTGLFFSDSPDIDQCLMFKLQSDGAVEWAHRIGGPLDNETDIGTGIDALPNDQIAVTGYRELSTPVMNTMLVIRTEADGTIPYCDRISPVSLAVTDIMSDLTPYTRDVTVYTTTPTVIDVTTLVTLQDLALTSNVFCNGLAVPVMSRIGILLILTAIGVLICRKK